MHSVSDGVPAKFLADPVAKLDHFFVGELHKFSGAHADHLVLRLSAVDQPVVGLLGVEKRLSDYSRLGKQDDRSIDCRFGDPGCTAGHLEQDLLNLEYFVTVNDRVENGRSFRSVFQASRFEKATKH